ncbi:MAG: hypothetical protein KDB23_27275, partial [Planctomycetales bacterium]|nr:hypothetical protein [Planctomycetales bacterium]
MSMAAIYIGSPHWIVPVAIVAALIIAAICWSYGRRTPRQTPWLLLALLLKIAAVLMLALCLLEPLQSGVRPRPGANVFAILIDDSRSMSVAGRGLPAGAEIPVWLGDETKSWRARLAQDFDVRTYSFAETLSRFEDREQLTVNGRASNLAGAFAALTAQFSDRPIAGVMLLSDGNRTDEDAQAAEQLPDCPI